MVATTAQCRILVVSSTTDTAHRFVQRIKALSIIEGPGEEGSSHSTSEVLSPAQSDNKSSLSELHAQLTNTEPATSIPWTITNKYYTADVHFELRPLDSFAGYLASEVPAVVYVWDRRDQHKTEVPELARKLQHYDPEVSLAVRFAPSSKDEPPHNHDESEEGEDGLDEFISSHGFEYVDGERGKRVPTQDGSSFSDEEHTGVPGLPRVIDALSTIMWPSLVQSQRNSSRRKSRGGDLLDWASMEDESGLGGGRLLPNVHDSSINQTKLKKEMDELETWLQEELDATEGIEAKKDHDDPWSTMHGREVDGYHDFDVDEEHKFEDDFDDFVGAPMDVTYDVSQPPRDTTTRYPASLGISSATNTSLPLFAPSSSFAAPHRAFTSDFVTFRGEVVHPAEDDHPTFDEDNEDPDMPTRAEIEEMSRHLFGNAGLGIPPSSPSWQLLHSPSAQSASKDLPPSNITENTASTSQAHPPPPEDSKSKLEPENDNENEDDDEDFELGAFDLTKVLGALQGMKEQIASMDDENERKRAAAKVALGLVYGLQKEDERDKERGQESM